MAYRPDLPAEPVGITDFLHFSITVRNIERSIRFYCEVLGMEPEPVNDAGDVVRHEADNYVAGVTGYADAHLKIACLRHGDAALELIEYVHPSGEPIPPGTNRPGCPHMAFIVKDLDAAWDGLNRMAQHWDLTFVSPGPVVVDSGPNRGARGLYFRDPDGVTIELAELTCRGSRSM